MDTAVCFIILCPDKLEDLYQMQKVVAGWQEYYEAISNENIEQAFVTGKNSIEIEDFKVRERGFRMEFDQSWVCVEMEYIGILVAAYEQIKEFIDEYYLPPIVHLVVKEEKILASSSFRQSNIFKLFADLGLDEFHIDVMKESSIVESELETMGEVDKEVGEWTPEEWMSVHRYFKRGSK